MKIDVVLALATVVILSASTAAQCPDYDLSDCERWSDNSTWPNEEIPADGDSVTINKCVILDDSTAYLNGITIEAGGSLIFDPYAEDHLTLHTYNIRVEGLLRIGSEQCRYEGKADIVLTGFPDDHAATDPDFGQKFIGVASGGQLELHGQRKTSWTKLDQTLRPLTNETGLFMDSERTPIGNKWHEGIRAVVINPHTGVVRFSDTFYLGNHQWWFDRDSQRLIDMMNWVPSGHVILMVSQRNVIGPDFNATLVYEAVEKAIYCKVGKSKLRNLKYREAWVLVAVKEQPWRTIERVGRHINRDGYKAASAHLSMPLANAAFFVETRTHGSQIYWYDARIMAATYDAGVPAISMAGDVSSWAIDDEVVIASTDFDWRQATTGRLEQCNLHKRNYTCEANQARIRVIPKYLHWGEITNGVDMRAEVGSLTRNVVIRSDDVRPICYDDEGEEGICEDAELFNFGGHITIKAGYGSARIEGVRLQDMGQDMDEAASPIYFDMVGDTNDTAYVRSNAIVDSNNRCVVLRGTNYLEVSHNVAYKHKGHCFYTKEGGEMYNVFDGNLAIGTEKYNFNDIEKGRPATYFITNPLTYFVNNVAAGSDAKGIMYAFPVEPLGDSRALGLMERDEASRTPFLQFDNNVGHSNHYTGIDFYGSLDDQGNYDWSSRYNFKSVPTDPNSDDVPVLISRSTCYKNRYENIQARGGWLVFDRSSVSDSSRGVVLIVSSNQRPWVTNSVVVGESANIGQPGRCWNGSANIDWYRSCPMYWDINTPIQGIPFADGPNYVENVFFDGFTPTEQYPSGALGFVRNNKWWTSPLNSVSGATWGFDDGPSTGNRVFDGNAGIEGFNDYTGDIQAFFRDLDGSVGGYANSTIVKPYTFIYTPDCLYRDNWMMYTCPDRYGKLSLWAGSSVRKTTSPFMTRDDAPYARFDQNWQTTANFPVILGGGYSYILHFDGPFPEQLWLTGDGVEKDLWFRAGVCVGVDTDFELYTYVPDWRPRRDQWNQVFSLQDLDATEIGTSYYWDNVTGVVYFKFINNYPMEPGQMHQCPQGKCPRVRITFNGGNQSGADCRERVYEGYTQEPPTRKRSANALQFIDLPKTGTGPAANQGARTSYPFAGIEVANGHGYGQWGEWSECTASCEGGETSRERQCEDAQGCSGDSVEVKSCNDQDCPAEAGDLTEWTEWGDCSVTCGGGVQSRSRECQSGSCRGDLTEEQDCNTQFCPIDGEFTDWSEWSACSVSCGGGEQTRERSCTDPPPQHGGQDCVGVRNETQDCNVNACPIDGGVTDWGDWSDCSVTCGGGQMTRTRTCTNPSPQHGGKDCEEALSESQECNIQGCPVDGGLTEWGQWGACSAACGGGEQSRERSCTDPAPQNGGANCTGELSQTQDCNTQLCPIDGGLTQWSQWSACSASCGGGETTRERSCTNPEPQHGGADCDGDLTQTDACNTITCSVDNICETAAANNDKSEEDIKLDLIP